MAKGHLPIAIQSYYCVVYQYTNENGERKQKWETYKPRVSLT